jgi:hypothetical protein
MIKLRSVLLFLLMMSIAGCSSQVTRPQSTDTTRPVVKALQDFTVEMSPEAKLQLSDNIKFDINALQNTLQRTLEANDLIAADGGYRLKVFVSDIRIRSTFNAVMWGFMAGDDHLQGHIVVLDLAGEPVYTFDASSSYALGGFGGGQDTSRLNWLYEDFSEMVADELRQEKEE